MVRAQGPGRPAALLGGRLAADASAHPAAPQPLLDGRSGPELALAVKQTLLIRSSEADALAHAAKHGWADTPAGRPSATAKPAGSAGGAVPGTGPRRSPPPAVADAAAVPQEVAAVAARVPRGKWSGGDLEAGEQRAVRAWLEAQGQAAATRYTPRSRLGADGERPPSGGGPVGVRAGACAGGSLHSHQLPDLIGGWTCGSTVASVLYSIRAHVCSSRCLGSDARRLTVVPPS